MRREFSFLYLSFSFFLFFLFFFPVRKDKCSAFLPLNFSSLLPHASAWRPTFPAGAQYHFIKIPLKRKLELLVEPRQKAEKRRRLCKASKFSLKKEGHADKWDSDSRVVWCTCNVSASLDILVSQRCWDTSTSLFSVITGPCA